MTKCELRITNRGDDPAVLASHVDEIATDLIRCMCRELSFKLSDDGKTYMVTFNLEDVPGLSMEEFKEEASEMAADQDDDVSYDICFTDASEEIDSGLTGEELVELHEESQLGSIDDIGDDMAPY